MLNVRDTLVGHDGNNYVVIDHGDGTYAWYFHIQQDGAIVERGIFVDHGAQLASVGNVGCSLTGQIHYVVMNVSYFNSRFSMSFQSLFEM